MENKNKKSTFENDLRRGAEGELKVFNYFKNKGYQVELNNSLVYRQLKNFDISITGKTISLIEVKDDYMHDETGNIALEYNCAEYTKSDFFVFVLGKSGLWYLPTEDLRRLLTSKHKGFNCMGGNEGRERLKIVSFDEFKIYAKQLN